MLGEFFRESKANRFSNNGYKNFLEFSSLFSVFFCVIAGRRKLRLFIILFFICGHFVRCSSLLHVLTLSLYSINCPFLVSYGLKRLLASVYYTFKGTLFHSSSQKYQVFITDRYFHRW